MTQTLAINEQNDIFLDDSGNVSLLSGEPAVEGACQTASQAQLGEMIYAATSGIPNFQVVWVGVPNPPAFEAALRQTLVGVLGVVQVKAISVIIQEGSLQYAAVVESEFGNEFTVSNEVSLNG